MALQLWYSPASPFVRKVLVCAHETGLADAITLLPGNVWEPDTAITADNPLGKVPALVAPEGVFAGSYLCCEYLDSLHAGPRLIPPDPGARWSVLQLHAYADGIIEAAVASVIEQVRRPKEFVYQGYVDRQSAKIVRTLDRIAPRPPGQVPDLAAVTLGCALGYLDFRMPQLQWREGRGALADWYATFAARKSMQATRPQA